MSSAHINIPKDIWVNVTSGLGDEGSLSWSPKISLSHTESLSTPSDVTSYPIFSDPPYTYIRPADMADLWVKNSLRDIVTVQFDEI